MDFSTYFAIGAGMIQMFLYPVPLFLAYMWFKKLLN